MYLLYTYLLILVLENLYEDNKFVYILKTQINSIDRFFHISQFKLKKKPLKKQNNSPYKNNN